MVDTIRAQWIIDHVLVHEPELRRWLGARLALLGRNDVDDVVQEALARVWVSDFSTIRNGRAYLYATVRHLLADYARRRRVVSIEAIGETEVLSIISEEPGPERLVGAAQELDHLRVIVSALPLQCRLVFELRKFEGLSNRDVAKRLNLSDKTVEHYLTRAFAKIKATSVSAGIEWTGNKSPCFRIAEPVPTERV